MDYARQCGCFRNDAGATTTHTTRGVCFVRRVPNDGRWCDGRQHLPAALESRASGADSWHGATVDGAHYIVYTGRRRWWLRAASTEIKCIWNLGWADGSASKKAKESDFLRWFSYRIAICHLKKVRCKVFIFKMELDNISSCYSMLVYVENKMCIKGWVFVCWK